MASELRVNTLKDASGNNSIGTSFVAEGTAKAWASRTSAATPATNDSFNIASLTDAGTGDTEYNLSSAMNNDGGACACANQSTSGDFGLFGDWKTTSKLRTLSRNSSGTDTDRGVTIMGTGDLA